MNEYAPSWYRHQNTVDNNPNSKTTIDSVLDHSSILNKYQLILNKHYIAKHYKEHTSIYISRSASFSVVLLIR